MGEKFDPFEFALKEKVWERDTWKRFLRESLLPLYRKIKGNAVLSKLELTNIIEKCVENFKNVTLEWGIDTSPEKADIKEIIEEIKKICLFANPHVNFIYMTRVISREILIGMVREKGESYEEAERKAYQLQKMMQMEPWFMMPVPDKIEIEKVSDFMSRFMHPKYVWLKWGKPGQSIVEFIEYIEEHLDEDLKEIFASVDKNYSPSKSIKEQLNEIRKKNFNELKISLDENDKKILEKGELSPSDFYRSEDRKIGYTDDGKVYLPDFLMKIYPLVQIGLIDLELKYEEYGTRSSKLGDLGVIEFHITELGRELLGLSKEEE